MPGSPTAPGSSAYRWRVLGSVLLAVMAFGTTNTILGAALQVVADDLDTDKGVLGWAITGPFLALGIANPIFGKVGDLIGHRRVFLAGGATFAISSLAIVAATNPATLIALRAVGGLGAAAASPNGLALVFGQFTGEERPKAMGWFNLVGTGGPALGLATGGALIDWLGWRTVFAGYGVLGSIGTLTAALVVHRDETRSSASLDVAGAGTLGTATFGAMLGMSLGGRIGWLHPAVLGLIAVVPVTLVLFVRAERSAQHPLIPLSFLANPTVCGALIAYFGLNVSYMGGLVLTPILFQDVLGLSLGAATALLVVRPATFAVMSPIGGSLVRRHGERWGALAGGLAMVASMITFVVAASAESLGLAIAALCLSGTTFGLCAPAATTAVANCVADADLGVATGVLNTAAAVGTATGIQLGLGLLGSATTLSGADFVVPLTALVISAGIGTIGATLIRSTIGLRSTR